MDYSELSLGCALERFWKTLARWRLSVDVIQFHYQASSWNVSLMNLFEKIFLLRLGIDKKFNTGWLSISVHVR